MSAAGWWLLIGVVVWCVASVPAAFVLGRAIGRRDAQKPAAHAQPEPQSVEGESDMDVFQSILDEPSPDHGMYRGQQ